MSAMSAQPLPPMQNGGSLDSMSSTTSSNGMGSSDVLSTSPLAATGNLDAQMQDSSRGDSYESSAVEPAAGSISNETQVAQEEVDPLQSYSRGLYMYTHGHYSRVKSDLESRRAPNSRIPPVA